MHGFLSSSWKKRNACASASEKRECQMGNHMASVMVVKKVFFPLKSKDRACQQTPGRMLCFFI
jgi:hypothetical protein